MVSLEFFIHIILPAALWAWNRNEYHEFYVRVTAHSNKFLYNKTNKMH